MTIEIKHLRKSYPDSTPIKDLNATINDGDVIAIIGPSGCGKSTLIRCINMIDPPTSGQIIVDGEDITDKKCDLSKLRQKIGMVFQSYNLFEHLTLVENVMLALTDLQKKSRQEAYEIAVAQLTKVGLGEKLLQYPDQLSGGQKQRVSIARALAVNPEVLLLDEPTSALDPTMVREVEAVIKNLAQSGKTMMIVTHEMRLAKAIANRIFFLDNGGLYEDGTPEEIFEHPQRERTKAFINHLKVMKYKFKVADFDYNECMLKLQDFATNNGISNGIYGKVTSVFDKLSKELLPKYVESNNGFNIITEYSEDNGTAKILLYASVGENEISDILSEYQPKTEQIEDEDYSIKVTITL